MIYKFKLPDAKKGKSVVAGHVFTDGVLEYEAHERPESLEKVLSYYGATLTQIEGDDSAAEIQSLQEKISLLEKTIAELTSKLGEAHMELEKLKASKPEQSETAPAANKAPKV